MKVIMIGARAAIDVLVAAKRRRMPIIGGRQTNIIAQNVELLILKLLLVYIAAAFVFL
jgi:hypothetical protein